MIDVEDLMLTAQLYDELNDEDKEIAINAFIHYIFICNVSMETIQKKVIDNVWKVLVQRRQEAINDEDDEK